MQDTICAISTPSGMGAVALIRISGNEAWEIIQKCLNLKEKKNIRARVAFLGNFYDNNEVLDQVVITCFEKPHSFTGENMVEIGCHGSLYIQKRIIEVLIDKGCRYAKAGEFTMRAFFNGKMDLSQAEAIADVIASDSEASLQLAMKNLRGEFSNKIKQLREHLLHFASMLELELDFSEEDVEFADRESMRQLMKELHQEIEMLVNSFSVGNAVKNGFPVAIVGYPNAGKSTLLNALLNEERAIVSEIPGTTRDTIEDTIVMNGQTFRFIDTAGIRNSQDQIEQFGIERTYQSIEKAMIILYVIDAAELKANETIAQVDDLMQSIDITDKKVFIVANKADLLSYPTFQRSEYKTFDVIHLSAKKKINMDALTKQLSDFVASSTHEKQILVSNIRHYEALKKGLASLKEAETAFNNGTPNDLVATDIRDVLFHLSSVTGEISNEDILGNIFSRFCIGK